MHSLNLYTDKDDGIIDLIPVVTELLKNSGIKLGSQAVGNMFYGMQGMNSDTPEVIELLKVMTRLAKTCTEDLDAQAVGMMFLGLKSMSSDNPEVIELLKVMTKLAQTCKQDLSAQNVGNMIYGMQGMSSNKPEVIELLKVLTEQAKTCDEDLDAQAISNALFGLISLFDESNISIMDIFRFLQSHYRRTISETEASSSFDDAMMLTSTVCYFDYFLRKKGVSEQLSRELLDMKTGLERLELLGLKAGKASSKVSSSEKLYVDLFRKALEKNSRYEMNHQWHIDGIECDIIIIDSSQGNIVANIEIDGVYHSEPRKQRLTKLRDEYLTDHHRIRVVRMHAKMVRENQEIVDTDVKRVLKDLDIDGQV